MGSRENGGKPGKPNENEVSVAKCTLTPFSTPVFLDSFRAFRGEK